MTDWYTRMVSGLAFPLHERLKGHDTVALRRSLEDSQWWSPAQLQDLQIRRLQDFLAHCQRHVPYYRRILAELDPASVTGVADLGRLPLLDKPLIRENIEALKADNAGTLSRFNTGGSSGQPLIFFLSRDRISHDVAAKWRATRWWDVDIGDPEIVLWGSPIELGSQDRLRVWRDRLLRTRLLPAFEMSAERLDEFLAVIRQTRPRMLFGYPSAFSHLARHARERGLAMDDLGIRVAFVTSEKLYDEQRASIESTFGCRVANGYGGRDAGFIAHQCPAGGMHISAEDIIVEIVDPTGRPLAPGQAGEIVVTHMATGEFPFIRYRTGDIGVLGGGTCPCGRGLPLLAEIQGRSTDFVVAADGTVMHGLALIYVLRDLPGIDGFKIIQERPDLTRVLIRPEAKPITELADRVVTGFRERLGETVTVQVEWVEEIPAEASGKFRYVVSHVTPGTPP